MDYLAYLADRTYDELPADVQTTISRAEYTERRRLVLSLREERSDLPPVLATAFRARTRGVGSVNRSRVRYLPWLAAAGWLLFLFAAGGLLLLTPSEKVVYRVLAAEAPPAEIVHVRDTVVQTEYRTRVRAQMVHDTLYLPSPPQLVFRSDTVYVPMPLAFTNPDSLRGSRSLADREDVLLFLQPLNLSD
ncbi:MAG: hypothetical protein AAFZ52_00540 [Bacteroidota bacterium]